MNNLIASLIMGEPTIGTFLFYLLFFSCGVVASLLFISNRKAEKGAPDYAKIKIRNFLVIPYCIGVVFHLCNVIFYFSVISCILLPINLLTPYFLEKYTEKRGWQKKWEKVQNQVKATPFFPLITQYLQNNPDIQSIRILPQGILFYTIQLPPAKEMPEVSSVEQWEKQKKENQKPDLYRQFQKEYVISFQGSQYPDLTGEELKNLVHGLGKIFDCKVDLKRCVKHQTYSTSGYLTSHKLVLPTTQQSPSDFEVGFAYGTVYPSQRGYGWLSDTAEGTPSPWNLK